MTDERDLTLLRQILSARSAQAPGALPRTRQLIADRQALPPVHARRRPRLVPAVAFASVVAVLAAMAWSVAGPSGGSEPVPGFAAPPELPPAVVLRALADAAKTASPMPLGDGGQLLYVRTEGAMANFPEGPVVQGYRHETWLDPEGLIPLRYRRYDGRSESPSLDVREPDTAADRARFAATGPSLRTPTAAWIAAWPTDTAALLALLRAGSRSYQGDWSVDYGLWEGLREFLSHADPLIPPAARATLYQCLATLDRLKAYEIVADGRRLYALRRTERDDISELLFDAETGRFAGDSSGSPGLPYVAERDSNVPDIPLQPDITSRQLVTWMIMPDTDHPR